MESVFIKHDDWLMIFCTDNEKGERFATAMHEGNNCYMYICFE